VPKAVKLPPVSDQFPSSTTSSPLDAFHMEIVTRFTLLKDATDVATAVPLDRVRVSLFTLALVVSPILSDRLLPARTNTMTRIPIMNNIETTESKTLSPATPFFLFIVSNIFVWFGISFLIPFF
jgi:hypothetical protein